MSDKPKIDYNSCAVSVAIAGALVVTCLPILLIGAWVFVVLATSLDNQSQLLGDSAIAVVGVGFGTAIFPFQMSVQTHLQRLVHASGFAMFAGALWASIGYFAIWATDTVPQIDPEFLINYRTALSVFRKLFIGCHLFGLMVWSAGCCGFIFMALCSIGAPKED